ncbi:ParB N-terminal domain-containing protein, partial [Paraburkholderia sp. SIMBA_055]
VDLKPGDKAYEELKASIEHFGYIDPLIWNEKTGNLVGGHQRFKILLESNPTEIKVSVVSLNEKEEKALNIALNKIEGDWDE